MKQKPGSSTEAEFAAGISESQTDVYHVVDELDDTEHIGKETQESSEKTRETLSLLQPNSSVEKFQEICDDSDETKNIKKFNCSDMFFCRPAEYELSSFFSFHPQQPHSNVPFKPEKKLTEGIVYLVTG